MYYLNMYIGVLSFKEEIVLKTWGRGPKTSNGTDS
jgi:hypothetical protein